MKKYRHLLVGGCSFSQDGLGGLPPTSDSLGGCSFKPDPDYALALPKSWPGFLSQILQVDSLVNTAASSHGNILLCHCLLACLNNYAYHASDTLVVFNLSDPARFDLICQHDHPDADNKNIFWDSTLIDFSFLNRKSKLITDTEKYLGFDAIERYTANCVDYLFNFPQHKKFDFYFMVMNDCSQTALAPVIHRFQDHLIDLYPGSSMLEYCRQTKTQCEDNFHPSLQGHRQIAEQVYSQIYKHVF